MPERVDLLVNASATGPSAQWPGGIGTFSVVGTFGGATVSLQMLGPDGATWLDCGFDTTLTSQGAGNFVLPASVIQAAVTGGTPSGLYAVAVS